MSLEHDQMHIGDVWNIIVHNWQLIAFGFGALVGFFWWFLTQTFTTANRTKLCKEEVLLALKNHEIQETKKLDTFMEETRFRHEELRADTKDLRSDIRWIRDKFTDHIINNNGNFKS